MTTTKTAATAITIEQRLDRLERQNKWLKRFALIPAALLALSCLTGATQQYDNGVATDINGVQRTWLGTGNGGKCQLLMNSRINKQVVFLGQFDDFSPGLTLSNLRGNDTIFLQVDRRGKPDLFFTHPNGTNLVQLGIGEHEDEDKGKPILYFSSPDGTVRMALSQNGLFFYDAQGNELSGTVYPNQ